jgi:cytochrome c553
MARLLFFVCLPLFADSVESLYFKNGCNSCHGNFAEGMGTAPKLSGRKEAELYARLKSLQAGKTRSPFGSVMISFAKTLDENQTRAMARWLSNLKKREYEERYELDDFFDNAGDGTS